MHLLELKNIGKIYASQSTVAVGIRGVDLSFDLGEFVAITGQSGSGKSTLLNVISGMDSYEEGEMYIEGETTSHYINEDWEKYREKYISFIFQDYNIIDSFTVLENVELALLHIEDANERRTRAKELIQRVGLASHMKQRGSHLSGGQKQRTVIARALAKDSPIILADEPTGNLDSQTSKEIIELLKEISKDKLIIIVTHNFEEVAQCATREIRVYDGAIKADRQIVKEETDTPKEISLHTSETENKKSLLEELKDCLKKGFKIGFTIFKRTPKLSLFLGFLFTVATLCLFLFVGTLGKKINSSLLEDNNMFYDENGRVVVTRRDGKSMSNEEVKELANKYDAIDYEFCDILCDQVEYMEWDSYQENNEFFTSDALLIRRVTDIGTPDIGEYPKKDDECLLYIPYSLKNKFNEASMDNLKVTIDRTMMETENYYFKIAGIKYYVDNNEIGKVYVTNDAYDACSYLSYFATILGYVNTADNMENRFLIEYDFGVDTDKPTVYVSDRFVMDNGLEDDLDLSMYFEVCKSLIFSDEQENKNSTKVVYNGERLTVNRKGNVDKIVINPITLSKELKPIVEENYLQCSLYFGSDHKRSKAINKINDENYIAIDASTKVLPYSDLFFDYLGAGMGILIILVMLISFLVLMVRICTKRSVDAFKNDIGIMRSMGIRVRVIKIAVYVRMLLAMFAPVICILILALWGYRQSFFSSRVMYMYPIHYAIIFAGLIIIVIRATKKQVQRLFSTTVKKSLRKGETS